MTKKMKWFKAKGRFYTKKELRELKKMESKLIGKHSKSYYKLQKRVKLLDKPSIVAISASGINMKTKDVQAYMKKHKLVERIGIIKRR